MAAKKSVSRKSRSVRQPSHKAKAADALPKLTLTPREARMQYLHGMSEPTFRQLLKAGKIKGIRFGHRILIPVAEMERFIADVENVGTHPQKRERYEEPVARRKAAKRISKPRA